MKTTLFALLFLCATAAFGQAGASLTSEPQPIQMPTHEQHANQKSMQTEQSLLFAFDSTSAKGERPLWEVGPKPAAEIPLGDVARLFRNEHATAKKAAKVLNK